MIARNYNNKAETSALDFETRITMLATAMTQTSVMCCSHVDGYMQSVSWSEGKFEAPKEKVASASFLDD